MFRHFASPSIVQLNNLRQFQMDSLSLSVYECNWTNNISHRIKIAMLQIMQTAQRGQKFRAGSIVDITVDTFVSVSSSVIFRFALAL